MATTGKRLMILGAGPFQLPIIKRAVQLGCYVITVDYLPESVGHRYSHQYVNASTGNIDAVLAAADRERIDGIVTFGSDVATPAVAVAAAALGLPGAATAAALTTSNKARFRQFQVEHGLAGPRFVVVKDSANLRTRVRELRPPLVVKPVDASGSRGLSKVEEPVGIELEAAFEFARQFSRSGGVCFEEFLPGVDLSGDGLLSGGKLVCAVPTHKHKQGFRVAGHCLPTILSEEDRQRTLAEVERTCRCLGYEDGPLDFDVVVDRSRVSIVEMSPRLGGNGIPQLIERGTGFDLIGATIRFALGEAARVAGPPEVTRRCGSLVFGSQADGYLERVASPGPLRAAHPEIFEFYCGYREGDLVPQFSHGGTSMGYALFDLPDGVDYGQKAQAIEQSLAIRLASVVESAC